MKTEFLRKQKLRESIRGTHANGGREVLAEENDTGQKRGPPYNRDSANGGGLPKISDLFSTF